MRKLLLRLKRFISGFQSAHIRTSNTERSEHLVETTSLEIINKFYDLVKDERKLKASATAPDDGSLVNVVCVSC